MSAAISYRAIDPSASNLAGLQHPPVSRVSIAPASRIRNRILIYPRYSCRRKPFAATGQRAPPRSWLICCPQSANAAELVRNIRELLGARTLA
jgi:hypothetical protein